MHSGMHTHSSQRVVEHEFAPLLFSLSAGDGPGGAAVTPRAVTPHRREDSSMSTQRRSATTPGSARTETTPPTPPPPVMRLSDDMVMDEPSSSKAARISAVPPPMQSLATVAHDTVLGYEHAPQYQDVWVTVFGFSQADTSLILKEMGKCGDILQWGTFGSPATNFLHVQFQNKYASQRALLRSGEQLSPSLIIGIKPLDARHRHAIEAYHENGGDGRVSFTRPATLPERSYRIDAPPAAAVPQPRSTVSKVVEFVFGF
ncbi:hypothetical protein FOA52_009300 [Chlamydomonas sp. UWO 241]|nr:hypothetical protein FOA52_009300 [Chlamydomonas sp. UWO 241]